MNTFVIIFVCSLALVSASQSADSKKDVAAEACRKEMNAGDVTFAIIKSIKVPENEAESCLLDCLYRKLQLIKDDALNSEGAKAIAVAKFGADNKEKLDKADAIFKKCEEEITKNKSSEKCGLAKQFRSCVIANAEQLEIVQKS